jgi:hypothetical protein
MTETVNTQHLLRQIQSSYMFRLQEAGIIRPHVSENINKFILFFTFSDTCGLMMAASCSRNM